MKLSKAVKAVFIIFTVLVALVLLYFAVACGMTGVFYSRFMGGGSRIARIPGLSDGFVPQGICRCDTLSAWLVCGYSDGSDSYPSRIYIIADGDGNNVKTVYLRLPDGSNYKGHAGGISCSGDMIWISNASKLFYMNVSDLASTDNGGYAAFDGSVAVGVNASFTFADETTVWVGEYHKNDDYQTAAENHLTTPDGSAHGAIILGFDIDPASPGGIATSPRVALSARDIVQGFCVTASGRFVLSCSSGLGDSHLYLYRADGGPDGVFSYRSADIPLYYLDSGRLCDTLRMPHMSEDLDYHDGAVIVGFEAGAKKYGAGLAPFSLSSIRSWRAD